MVHGERQLHVADPAQRYAAFAVLGGFRRVGREQLVGSGTFGTRDWPELLLHQLDGTLGVEIAGDDEDRVVGLVVLAVERLQPVDGHVLDVRPRTDGRVAVVVPLKGRRQDAFLKHPAGTVFAALPLVAHHGHLGFEILPGDEGIDHAVGFEVEGPRQIVFAGG